MNVIEYAIQMELDGEKFYREQAENNKGNSLYTVCLKLAEDEQKHAAILKNKLNKLPYELTDSSITLDTKNVFAEAEDIKLDTKAEPSQLDFYRIASSKEQESIDLYEDFLTKATDDKDQELFKYLIKQERQHLAFLEELVSLLRKGEEWVESAEFGLREEY